MITTRSLRASWDGKDKWISDGGFRNGGRLVARMRRNGVFFLYQYFPGDGRKMRYPLGIYDESGASGISLTQARARAAELSELYRNGVRDLHAYFKQKRAEEERVRVAREDAARQAAEESRRTTLGMLMDAYVAHLKGLGKTSAGDVHSIFQTHVRATNPELVNRKASEIAVEDFVCVIGAVVEARKGRTAAKLRSYLRAAYALAIRSRTDPAAPQALRGFNILANPLASVAALSQFNRRRRRHLNVPELAALLKRLEGIPPGAKRDALELCLHLGGQRPTQLLRSKVVDVDLPGRVLTLYDPKGARTQPRVHVVPLTETAAGIVQRRLDANLTLREETRRNGGEVPQSDLAASWLFTTDGITPVREETVSELVKEISIAMVREKEARESWQLRDLRRTVETMLASLGTVSDLRAQVQSHGLGGVQARHYDQHDYLAEKAAVLRLWEFHLRNVRMGLETPAQVTNGQITTTNPAPGSTDAKVFDSDRAVAPSVMARN